MQSHLYFFFYLVYLAMEWLRYQVSFHLLKKFIVLKYCRDFKENVDCKFVDFARSNFIVFILTLEYVALSRSLQLRFDESHRNAQHFFLFFQKTCSIFRKIFSEGSGVFQISVSSIHSDFSKTRDTFQNAENEGSFFMSKPRNGPNRGMFISVAKFHKQI